MDQAPPVQSCNALDVYIMLLSSLFRTKIGIALMVDTGDFRASGNVQAVSTQFRNIVRSVPTVRQL